MPYVFDFKKVKNLELKLDLEATPRVTLYRASQERLKCQGLSGSKMKGKEMGYGSWEGRKLRGEGVRIQLSLY